MRADERETTSVRHQAVTVREVCAEIYLKTYDSMFRTSNVIGWRDRILSAYEREMAAKDAEIAKIVTLCNRLEAALKPVMYVHITEDDMTMDVFDSKMDAVKCVNVVRSVQAAMKEVKV